MTAFLEETCRFRTQQNSPVVLEKQTFQGLLLDRRQVLFLLFEIEGFEPRPVSFDERISGGTPEIRII